MRPIVTHVAWFCGCLSVGQEPSVSSAKTDEPIAMLLPARRNASAGTSYGPVSVCLSVCLSVTSRSSIETDERIEQLVFDKGAFSDLSYTVL